MTTNKLPNFFIVGASKAGTTAICHVLADHPDVCFSSVKEPNFFSKFDIALKEIPPTELLEYQELFKDETSKKLRGEGSVGYLNSDQALYWIHNYVPSAKIIIILRNPLERIVSLYEMYDRLGKMKLTYQEAFASQSYLVKQSILYQFIINYINVFSREQVFIMIYDDFKKNPQQELKHIYQFLGIAENFEPVVVTRNKGGVPKSKLLNFLKFRPLVEVIKRIIPVTAHAKVDTFIKDKFFQKTKLTLDKKRELMDIFYPDVEKIGNLLNRNLCKEWLTIDDKR
ncbi:MAG: sulfotransferase [Crocosphaera sp.]|nr:sulfotransferase [Crocosphaera sp.]